MQHFHWVTARSKCTPEELFGKLRDRVKGDVQTAVRVTGRKIEFSPTSNELFHVARIKAGGNQTLAAVGFQLVGHQIVVIEQGGTSHAARAALQHGSCRLTDDDGRCFELWEFSRDALEDLFFG
ncbi:MAG: hypothetical protein F4X11_23325 [Acidobacteria bacterium]|nr:hypothetical protein [Acidobacteriota bacterium]